MDVARKLAENASVDLGQIGSQLSEQGKKLKDIAGSFLSELQDRYNSAGY